MQLKRNLTIVAVLAIIVSVNIVGWMFYAANTAVVTIDLLGMAVIEVTVWKLALTCFALGAGVVLLLSGFLGLRGLELRRRYRKTIRKLESELHQLRSLPLTNDPDAQVPAPEPEVAKAAGGQG